MKKSILIICFLPLFAMAQQGNNLKDTLTLATLPIDATGNLVYTTIVNLPVSKADLYQRAKIWAALAFNSAKTVTQYDDAAGSNIVIKAIDEEFYTYKFLGASYPVRYFMYFSLHFTFAENKYRAVIEDLSFETITSNDILPVKEPFEGIYKHLKEWNGNIKSGNEEFNREQDMTKKEARMYGQIVNNVAAFAATTIDDIKKHMLNSAKGDDF